jgi:hypothetical protein
MGGGDMLNLMMESECFTEDKVRFYAAELTLAIEVVHSIGYVHRDIKPDNVLIGADGHIKLADFGTCSKVDDRGRAESKAVLGTHDYIAPEVLENKDLFGGREAKSYTTAIDWWALGVVIYEMLAGDTPFFADSQVETYSKIQGHRPESLTYPPDLARPSAEAHDLICCLLCDKGSRLDANGIKQHAFFAETVWDTMASQPAPWVPDAESIATAANFPDDDDEPQAAQAAELLRPSVKFEGNQLPFIGWSYHPAAGNTAAVGGAAVGGGGADVLTAAMTPISPMSPVAPTMVISGSAQKQRSSSVASSMAAAAEVAALSEELGKLKQMVTSLQTEAVEREAAAENLESKLRTEAEQLSAGHEEDVAKLQKEFAEQQRSLAQERLRIVALEQQARHREAQLQPAPSPSKAAEEKRLARLNEELGKERDEAKAAADLAAAQAARLAEELQQTIEKSAAVAQELAELRVESKRQEEHGRRAQRSSAETVDRLEEKLDQLQRKVKRSYSETEATEEANSMLSKEVAGLKVKLAASDSMAEIANADLAELQELHQNKVAALNQQVAELERTPPPVGNDAVEEMLRKQADAELEKRKASEAECARIQPICAALKADGCRLEAELATAQASVAELEVLLEAARTGRSEAVGRWGALENELASEQTTVVKLRARVEEELANNVDLVTDLGEEKEQVLGLERRLAATEAEKAAFAADILSLSEKFGTLQATFTSRTEELKEMQTLKAAAAQLESQLEALQTSRDAIKARVTEAQRECDRLDVELTHARCEAEREAATAERLRLQLQEARARLEEEAAAAKEAKRQSRLDMIGFQTAADEQRAKYEQERSAAELRLSELVEELEEKHKEVELQKVRTREAVTKITQVAGLPAVGSSRDNRKEERRMKMLAHQATLAHDRLLVVEEQHREALEVAGRKKDAEYIELLERVRSEHREEKAMLSKMVESLKESLTRRSMEVAKLQRNEDRLSQVYEIVASDDPTSVLSPPMKMIKDTLSKVNDCDGWLEMRKDKSSRKRSGRMVWEDRFCVLDAETLSVFLGQNCIGPAEKLVEIRTIHSARGVTKETMIHAKAADIPRIFQVNMQVTGGPEGVGSGGNGGPGGVTGSGSSTLSSLSSPSLRAARHNKFPGIGGKGDEYEFRGHYFIKVAVSKLDKPFCRVCNTSIKSGMFSGKKAVQCNYCQEWCHEEHIVQNSDRVKPCAGCSGIETLTFLARDVDSKKLWIERITKAVVRRSTANAHITGTPTKLRPPMMALDGTPGKSLPGTPARSVTHGTPVAFLSVSILAF